MACSGCIPTQSSLISCGIVHSENTFTSYFHGGLCCHGSQASSLTPTLGSSLATSAHLTAEVHLATERRLAPRGNITLRRADLPVPSNLHALLLLGLLLESGENSSYSFISFSFSRPQALNEHLL